MKFPHESVQPARFQFENLHPEDHYMQIAAIGWDTIKDTKYLHYGKTMQDQGRVIFQITLSGSGKFSSEGHTMVLTKHMGFMCLIPGEQTYYFSPDCGHWEFLYISIRGRDAIAHWTSLIDKLGHVIDFSTYTSPLEMLSKLYHDFCVNRDIDEYELSGKLYLLLLDIYKAGKSINGNRLVLSDYTHKTMQYVEKHYAEHITLQDLAHQSGYTVEHFSRSFRVHVGIPPMEYVRKIRLEKAAVLLSNGKYSLEKIASLTGFSNKAHLSKTFKDIVGVTPGTYRKGCINGQYLSVQH